MTTPTMTPDEMGAALRALVESAAPAVRCPDDMAESVLVRARRARRVRVVRVAAVTGALVLLAGGLAASTLVGHSRYYSAGEPSESMTPTLPVLSLVTFDKELTPQRNDVVQLSMTNDGVTFPVIIRVIGVAGDTVACPSDAQGVCVAVLVNGTPIADPYLAALRTKPFASATVPNGTVFVLGDNRENSVDSRIVGPVALQNIKGVAVQVTSNGLTKRPIPGAPTHPSPTQQIDPPGPLPSALTSTP
jgi:signal peptidase I